MLPLKKTDPSSYIKQDMESVLFSRALLLESGWPLWRKAALKGIYVVEPIVSNMEKYSVEGSYIGKKDREKQKNRKTAKIS